MLIILEGLDRSGKSFYTELIKRANRGSVLIKRQHDPRLYPIDYNEGSLYDWQAIYDRVILANPDTLFIADRSFFTHIIYQSCLIKENVVKPEHIDRFNSYCEVLTSMPHLVIYTESNRYELDGMIVNRNLRNKISDMYKTIFGNIKNLNFLLLNIDDNSLYDTVELLQTKINNIISK
jgi:thymidylate kinase